MLKTKMTVPSEYAECVLLAQYLDLLKRTGKIRQYSHIPNETWTPSHAARAKNKAMGVSAGIPDYIVVTNNDVLFIEMKKSKGGTISESQKAWIESITASGHKAVVCAGYNQAEAFLTANLKEEREILNAYKARVGLLDH